MTGRSAKSTRRRVAHLPPPHPLPDSPACWRWKVPTRADADRLQEKHLSELRQFRPGSEPRPLSKESLRWILMAEMHKGRCAICGRRCSTLRTDHDHTTGLIRGFLCPSCNTTETGEHCPDGLFGKYRAIHPALMCGVRREYYSGWGGAVVLPADPAG